MRGLFFTLATSLLFGALLAWALSMAVVQSDAASRLVTARKVAYTWADIDEDLANIIGVKLIENGTNLTVLDRLPANVTITDFLKAYSQFVAAHEPKELNVTWLDPADNQIALENLAPVIMVLPMGINYSWADWGKRVLHVQCPGVNCTTITQLDLSYNMTNGTFQDPPDINHSNSYKWSPDSMKNGCNGAQAAKCINFTLAIQDSLNQTFSCPGPICNYTRFPYDSKSTMDIKAVPCWLSVRLGDSGPVGGSYDIVEIRLHAPNNPNMACDTETDASTNFVFNTTNWFVNFLTKLEVMDVNKNASKRAFIGS